MECVQVPNNNYVVSLDKNTSITASIFNVYPLFVELLRVLPYRKHIVVKARDVCIHLKICDHYTLTSMGRLLRLLEKLGLAKRLNNTRPIHYLLDHDIFSKVKQFCRIEKGEDFCIETGCSLLGICPYWRIKYLRRGLEK